MATVKKIIGKVPVYRGEWTAGVEYLVHNIVSYMGSSFICKADNTNKAPATFSKGVYSVNSEYWDVMADGSYSYVSEASNELMTQEEFETLKGSGKLEEWKTYYTYED